MLDQSLLMRRANGRTSSLTIALSMLEASEAPSEWRTRVRSRAGNAARDDSGRAPAEGYPFCTGFRRVYAGFQLTSRWAASGRSQASRLSASRSTARRFLTESGANGVERHDRATAQRRVPGARDDAVDEEGGQHVAVLADHGPAERFRKHALPPVVGEQEVVPLGQEANGRGHRCVRPRCIGAGRRACGRPRPGTSRGRATRARPQNVLTDRPSHCARSARRGGTERRRGTR